MFTNQLADAVNHMAATTLRPNQLADAVNHMAATTLRPNQLADAVNHMVEALYLARRNYGLPIASAESGSATRRMISRREVAVYLTIVMFLFVYISLSLAISQDPKLATLSREDGPIPFDAAMGIGALTFWAVMSWRRP